mmetsp:Transcript_5300/g.11607  ORF Transcript_5300/g.11607 Transcript_5300/m.11607 type:complete len:88 (+) Transcript_5300:1871-2134(+)
MISSNFASSFGICCGDWFGGDARMMPRGLRRCPHLCRSMICALLWVGSTNSGAIEVGERMRILHPASTNGGGSREASSLLRHERGRL